MTNEAGFRQLRVYNDAIELISEIYILLNKYPQDERFALCNQIRRAAISVSSNIAEGSSRSSKKDFAHFIEISYGSLMEVRSQMDISKKLNYITNDEFDYIDNKAEAIARMLSGLRKSLINVES